MAATTNALTEAHRQAQLELRARTLHDFSAIWPMWQANDPATFDLFVKAAIPLVRAYRTLSASVAVAYYEAFRRAERIAGVPTSRLAGAIDEKQILSSLYVTGDVMNRKALASGQSPENARTTAFVRTSGAATRLVLDGGRQTILDSVDADPHAVGWARVTDGNPCYFCLTLASRGAVYKSEQTASFEAHDHCGCSAMPVYDGTDIPQLDRWQQIYEQAQRDGIDSGLLEHGENSTDARLNAVRQYLAAH
jgi:hypothetical protein